MRPFSFFNATRLPYYIYTQGFEFTDRSAGIRALHYLCHALNELGAEAYLIGSTKESDFLRTPLLRKSDVMRHQKSKKIPIVVYPEVVRGNPLNMPNIVRWLLNKPGALGGDEVFSDSELLFAYTKDYIPTGSSIPLLTVPSVNGVVFNNYDNSNDSNRNGYCFYAHKYLLSGGKLTKHAKGATSLCQDVDLSPSEIAAVLRRSVALYCYEPSAIVREALLCGCPVIIVPSSFLDENLSYPIAGPGIASTLDPDAIIEAKQTVGLAEKMNEKFIFHCKQHVNNFIPRTQLVFFGNESSSEVNEWSDHILDFLSILNNAIVRRPEGTASVRLVGEKKALNINLYKEWQRQRKFCKLTTPYLTELALNKREVQEILIVIIFESGDLSLLADTIDSLSAQLMVNWHLTVISPLVSPDKVFDELESLTWLEIINKDNPYDDINKCIRESKCEWLGVVDAGVMFAPDCIAKLVGYIQQNEKWSFVYTDEDHLNEKGERVTPFFKPDFNLDLLRSSAYIGNSCFIRMSSLQEIGGFYAFPGMENYDWAFQVYEKYGEQAIGHISDVLVHRSFNGVREFDAELGLQILINHLNRTNTEAVASHSEVENSFCVNYKLDTASKVSIIILVKDQLPLLKACIESILAQTSYPNYDIIVVDNESQEQVTKDYLIESCQLNSDKLRFIEYEGDYNAAAMTNLAAKEAIADYLVFLNHDTMVLQAEWLHGMLSHAQRKDVGIVGAKLVYPNKTLQHTGLILGMGKEGIVGFPMAKKSMNDRGYMDRAMLVQNFSAVSSTCLMVNKALYSQLKGLNEKDFSVIYYDVDLCLRIKQLGYRVVWTPYVTLIHHGDSLLEEQKKDEIVASKIERNTDALLNQWLSKLSQDPSYNKNLSLKEADYQIDNSLNCAWNIDFKDKPKVYAFPHDSYGVGQYRVRAPINALTRAGIIESGLANNWDDLIYPTPVEIERIKPDVLLTQNAFLDHMRMPWQRYRKFNDAFMVCGLDDLVYMLPHQHPKQGVWPTNIRRKVKQLFQSSDRVVVANDALAEEFSKMTTDIVVVPNYLENWRWDELKKPTKQMGKKLRVGWAGGSEHISDLIFILPVVEALHNEVDWIFMGLALEELKPFVKEFHAGVEFDLYPQKLANLNLDLSIAPLMHNRFNECKTNLRLLEYGVMGWPVVCSDILPYQAAPVTRVANNVNEWVRVIREKINEPDELLKEGELLKQWVVDNYMLSDHVDEWSAALLP